MTVKRILTLLATLVFASSFACAQTETPVTGAGGLNIYKVSQLLIAPKKGTVAVITDGSSTTDCGTGGGADVVVCQFNGVAWSAVAQSGVSGVSSFNGRTGAIAPTTGDYTASQVTNAVDLSTAQTLANKSVAGNGTSSLVPLATIASQLFNVKAYGAAGDGVTDDTTAIQNAINAAVAVPGGIVYFPAGKYDYTNLTISNSSGQGVTLEGAGPAGGGPGSQSGALAASYLWQTGTGVGLTVGSPTTFSYNGPIIANLGFHEGTAGHSAGAILEWNQWKCF